jgi:hypothetical protein
MKYLMKLESFLKSKQINELVDVGGNKLYKSDFNKKGELISTFDFRNKRTKVNQLIEKEPKVDKNVDGLTGKEIMDSVSNGYYYHGSHIPNLTKQNIKLMSTPSDIGAESAHTNWQKDYKPEDRYGFYITSDIIESVKYSYTWVDSSEELFKEGSDIVEKMRRDSLLSNEYSIKALSSITGISKDGIEFIYNEYKKDIGYEPDKETDIIEYSTTWEEEDGNKFYKEFASFLESPNYDKWNPNEWWTKYKDPYNLIEKFAKKQGISDRDLDKIRSGKLKYTEALKEQRLLFGTIAAVKRGYWPTIYKIKLRPDDIFMPKLDLKITRDEVIEYTKDGVVGIYSGKLASDEMDSRDEIAILNRNAISSMEKVDDNTYNKSKKEFWDQTEDYITPIWEFSKKLLSNYK